MDIETRVTNLENLVDSLVKSMYNNKTYTDADIAGVRKNVSEITPYKVTKKAYIDDTEVVFVSMPTGNISVFLDNPSLDYNVSVNHGTITVQFKKPLEEVTEVTISIN